MASTKSQQKKEALTKANRTKKRAPIWVYAKTNRSVRDSPKSRRHWRRNSIF